MSEEEEKDISSSSPNNPSKPDANSFSKAGKDEHPNSTGSDSIIFPAPLSSNLPPLNPPSPNLISPIPSELSLSEQLSEAETIVALNNLRRKERIKAFDEWIGFITIKTIGISSLIVGGLEIIVPSFLTVALSPPFTPITLVGIGLSFLTGTKSIFLIKRVLQTLAEEDQDSNP